MEAFRLQVNSRYDINLKDYMDLYKWSINNIADFWKAIWGFMSIEFSNDYSTIIDDEKKMPGAKWFEGSKLNFAENLLKYRDENIAVEFFGENEIALSITLQITLANFSVFANA